jgi:hypothetical protein
MTIPGIGRSLAADLRLLGIERIEDLPGRNPHELYEQLCAATHSRQDPCVLYTFRCAVYFAEGGRVPELQRWWSWKGRLGPNE